MFEDSVRQYPIMIHYVYIYIYIHMHSYICGMDIECNPYPPNQRVTSMFDQRFGKKCVCGLPKPDVELYI